MKRKASTSTSQGSYKKKKPDYKRQKAVSVGIGQERKFNDVTVNTDASTTSTEVALTTFAAGDTALLRDGNKALVKSIELRINVANEAVTQNNTVRFVVVMDHQSNVAQCTWNGTGAVFDAATTVARRLVANIPRFTILMDKTFTVNQGSDGAPQQLYFKKYIKVNPDTQLVCWQDGASGIPVTNAITLMYLGSTASGATDLDVQGTVRVNFVG